MSLLPSETAHFPPSLLLYTTLTSPRKPSRIDSKLMTSLSCIPSPFEVPLQLSPCPQPRKGTLGSYNCSPSETVREAAEGDQEVGGVALSEFPKSWPARPQRPPLGRGGCPACALPAAQGSLCEPFPAWPRRKQQGSAPQWAHSAPSSLERTSASCHPPTLAWRTRPNRLLLSPAGRVLEAGGSVVRDSQLLKFLPAPQLDCALTG